MFGALSHQMSEKLKRLLSKQELSLAHMCSNPTVPSTTSIVLTQPASSVNLRLKMLCTLLSNVLLCAVNVPIILQLFERILRQYCAASEVDCLLRMDELLLQFIIDCSHDSIHKCIILPLNYIDIFEPVTRQWCFGEFAKASFCNVA